VLFKEKRKEAGIGVLKEGMAHGMSRLEMYQYNCT